MHVTLINMFFYCTASKRTLPQWCMASADSPGIMFVGFFGEKCLLAIAKCMMVIPGCIVCRGSTWWETKLGPNVCEWFHLLVHVSTAHMIAEVQMWVEKVAWISDINPAVTSELWFYDDIYLHRTPFTDWHLTSGVLQISFWLGSAPFSCFFASSAHSRSRGTSRLVSLPSASDPALEEL